MKRLAQLVLVSLVLFGSACTEETSTSLDDVPFSEELAPLLAIIDGSQGEGGNPHFFWLPPIVKSSKSGKSGKGGGVALTDLYPVLEICTLDPFTGDCDQVVAAFSRDSRSKKDRIKAKSKKYELNLKASDHQLEPGMMYRMRVVVGSAVLGVADIYIEERGGSRKSIRASKKSQSGSKKSGKESEPGYISVNHNSTLPVQFRINEGALEFALCEPDENGVIDCDVEQVPVDPNTGEVEEPVRVVVVDTLDSGEPVAAVVDIPAGAVVTDQAGDPVGDFTIVLENIEELENTTSIPGNSQVPYFADIRTDPPGLRVGNGVDVVICQEHDFLDDLELQGLSHYDLRIFRVPANPGDPAQLLPTEFNTSACDGALPAPAPQFNGSVASALRTGLHRVGSFFAPTRLYARRRAHGGLNTILRSPRDFSEWGATLTLDEESSIAIIPPSVDMGQPLTGLVEARNALDERYIFDYYFDLAADSFDIVVTAEVVSGPNTGTTLSVNGLGEGHFEVGYTPTSPGLDEVEIRMNGDLIAGNLFPVAVSAALAVTNTADAGPGSLRAALLNANAQAGSDSLEFQIPGAGPHVITLATPLPVITDPVVVDAKAQAGYDGKPVVEIDGSGTSGSGLEIQAGASTVRGLAITGFSADGLFLWAGVSNITVEDNFIGTDRAGSAGKGNQNAGIRLRSSSSNLRRNLISGNAQNGVLVEGVGASGNTIENNVIGLDPAGTASLANGWNGITMYDGTPNTTITGNRIAGNFGWGIDLQQSGALAQVSGAQILDNVIGLDANGDVFPVAPPSWYSGPVDHIDSNSMNWGPVYRGNRAGGIRVHNTVGTVIGAPAQGNTLSGNTEHGLLVMSNGSPPLIQGNFIGTDPTGSAGRANTNDGINLQLANTVIGGTGPGEGNVISGNLSDGVRLEGNSPNNVRIEGNFIGPDVTGTVAIGNGQFQWLGCCHSGVQVDDATGVVVGGSAPGARNVISGNHTGLWIGAAPGIRIENNYIGLDASGTSYLPNDGDAGIALYTTQNGQILNNDISGNAPFNPYGAIFSDGGRGNNIEGNRMTGNTSAAITFFDGGWASGSPYGLTEGNTFRSNQIWNNGELGIDLGWNGITPNDAMDADSGPNRLQNFPVLEYAHNGTPGQTTVKLELVGEPSTFYQIEIFSSSTCDASGYGEGEVPESLISGLGTNGSGQTSLAASIPTVAAGRYITATATHPDGSTSEFSQCVQVTANAPYPEIYSSTPQSFAGAGQGITFHGSAMFNTQWSFKNTSTGFTQTGFTFLSPSTGTTQYVLSGGYTPAGPYVPPLPGGNYEVTVTDTGTGFTSPPFYLSIGATFGTPQLVGVFANAGDASPLTTLTAGSTVYIQGYGTYTTGTRACFTQSATAPTAGPGCAGTLSGYNTSASSGSTIGIRAQIGVPAGLTTGPVYVQIQSGSSDFSAPILLNVF